MNVGSTVRAKRRIRRPLTVAFDGGVVATNEQEPQYLEIAQQAVIATIEENETTTACLIWESINPKPISVDAPFMITPNSAVLDLTICTNIDNDVEETEVPIESLLPLYSFETNPPAASFTDSILNVQLYKEFGDLLYQVHDFVAAITYYEYALYLSCDTFQVGATIFIKDGKGYIVAAEIDCIDMDHNQEENLIYDITIIESGEGKTIHGNNILLSLLPVKGESLPSKSASPSNDIQVRILLNLSRCLLQFVEICSGIVDNRQILNMGQQLSVLKETYCKRVVLATSLALTTIKVLRHDSHYCKNSSLVARIDNDTDALSKLEISALFLRSKAQYQLKNKLKHAIMDLQKIPSSHKAAQQLLRLIQMHQSNKTKTDRRLAKDVSKWIQTTLHHTETGDNDNSDDNDGRRNNEVCLSRRDTNDDVGHTESLSVDKVSTTTTYWIHRHLMHSWIWFFAIILVVVLTATRIIFPQEEATSASRIERDENEF